MELKNSALHRRVVDIYKRGPLYTTEALLAAQSFGELVARYKYLHELALRDRAMDALRGLNWVKLYGQAPDKGAIVAFSVEGAHPHDVAQILDRQGVAVRAGHHCAQPVMQRFGVPATARASFAFYNRLAEVDALVDSIARVQKVFG